MHSVFPNRTGTKKHLIVVSSPLSTSKNHLIWLFWGRPFLLHIFDEPILKFQLSLLEAIRYRKENYPNTLFFRKATCDNSCTPIKNQHHRGPHIVFTVKKMNERKRIYQYLFYDNLIAIRIRWRRQSQHSVVVKNFPRSKRTMHDVVLTKQFKDIFVGADRHSQGGLNGTRFRTIYRNLVSYQCKRFSLLESAHDF